MWDPGHPGSEAGAAAWYAASLWREGRPRRGRLRHRRAETGRANTTFNTPVRACLKVSLPRRSHPRMSSLGQRGWPGGVRDPARSRPVPSNYTALNRLLHLCPSNDASPSLPHRRRRESGAPATPWLAKIGGSGGRRLGHSKEIGGKKGRCGGTRGGRRSEDGCPPPAGPCGVGRAAAQGCSFSR